MTDDCSVTEEEFAAFVITDYCSVNTGSKVALGQ